MAVVMTMAALALMPSTRIRAPAAAWGRFLRFAGVALGAAPRVAPFVAPLVAP